MQKLFDIINHNLKSYIDTIENEELRIATNYSLMPGGKRLRPLLVLTILEDKEIDLSMGIDTAVAIELIHTYSLIHDDLPAMDDDDYRRGKLSLHKRFNESLAILTGDSLLSDSFRFFSKTPIDSKSVLKIINLASEKIGSNGMVKGQVLDISFLGRELTLKEIKEIHEHKTKDLINLAIICAGEIIGVTDKFKLELEDFSSSFGYAFQLKDDIDDYISGKDLENNRPNYVSVVGLGDAKLILEDYINRLLELTDKLFGQKSMYKLIQEVLG